MSTLIGTGSLVRLALRLDRVRLPVWILVTVVTAISIVGSIEQLYPDEASRQQIAGTIGSNPAMLAIYGPIYDTSLGAVTMWRLAIIGALLVGIMSIQTINRHTRTDEEAGRLELIGATVVGRHAPMAAALIVTAGANFVVALFVAVSLLGQGLPTDGSLIVGLALGLLGLVLAAAAAVAAQLTENARTVTGISAGVFGVMFLMRSVGDAGGYDWLTWLTPVGWLELTRPYAENRWWVLVMLLGFAVVLVGVAYMLVGRRDFGAGLVPPRPGPADAGPGLRGPFGLAWRLHRMSMIGWAIGFLVMGAALGSVATGVTDLVKDNPQMAEIFAQMGGTDALIDVFMGAILGIVALVTAVYSVQATLRLRSEETQTRAEPVLATSISRIRWATSHLVFAAAGTLLMLLAAGVGAGFAYGAQVNDISGQLPRVLNAALVQLPATLVVAGIAVALFGLAPRYVVGAWAALTLFLLLGQLGPLLQLPQWAMDLSPFTHVPRLGFVTAGPLVWLTVVAGVLTTAGLVGFRRRDIG